MSDEMLYLVVDSYPRSGTDAFRSFAGAAVGCWIRFDLCAGGTTANTIVEQRLGAAGWSVARILARENVSSKTYLTKKEGRQFFDQARIDGFVANFHACARQIIGNCSVTEDEVNDALVELESHRIRRKSVSLYSNQHMQWANGTTGKGNEFVPLWFKQEDARAWLPSWPGYDLRNITQEDLRQSGFFERVNEANMWIGLGVGTSFLTICHPLWIKKLLLFED